MHFVVLFLFEHVKTLFYNSGHLIQKILLQEVL